MRAKAEDAGTARLAERGARTLAEAGAIDPVKQGLQPWRSGDSESHRPSSAFERGLARKRGRATAQAGVVAEWKPAAD